MNIGRALGRRGVPVVAFHPDENEVCLASKYVRPVVLPPLVDNEQAWLDALHDHARAYAPVRPVLFAAGDDMWLFIARNAAALRESFHFALPAGKDPTIWPTKPFQYEAAKRLGIPFPETAFPASRAELEKFAASVRFPCLLKPALSFRWFQHYGEKLTFVHNKRDLLARGYDAFAHKLDFMVQEYIPAPDHEVFGFYSCLDARSQLIGGAVSRKIRQHEPLFGSSCLSRSVNEPRVAELALRLLQGIGFHGISSVEFKRDPRDGAFKLMEINVRSPLLAHVVIRSGLDLPYLSYCELLGLPIPDDARRFAPGKQSGLLMQDLHSMAFYRQRGELSLATWARQWLGTCDLHFAWDDLRPFRRYLKVIWLRWRAGKYRRQPDAHAATPHLYAEPATPHPHHAPAGVPLAQPSVPSAD